MKRIIIFFVLLLLFLFSTKSVSANIYCYFCRVDLKWYPVDKCPDGNIGMTKLQCGSSDNECLPDSGCHTSSGGAGSPGGGPPGGGGPSGNGSGSTIPGLSSLGIGGVPTGGIGKLSNVLGVAVTVLTIFAILLCLLYVIWGAYFWITSEGDKQKLHQARQRIVFAVIGLIVVFIAWAIIGVVNNFFFASTSSPYCAEGYHRECTLKGGCTCIRDV